MSLVLYLFPPDHTNFYVYFFKFNFFFFLFWLSHGTQNSQARDQIQARVAAYAAASVMPDP